MKKILFFLIPVLIAGCNKQETIKIHGTVPDAEGKYLVLEKSEINTPISLDSVKIKKSGNFKLEIPVSEPDFYQLSFSNRNFVSLLGLPGENIGLKFKTNDLSSEYEVTGSEGSILVQQLDVQLRNTLHEMDSITELYRSNIDSPGFDSLSVSLNDS